MSSEEEAQLKVHSWTVSWVRCESRWTVKELSINAVEISVDVEVVEKVDV